MKYDSKNKFVGVTGKIHKSAAEAKASFKLYPNGWLPYEEKFPQTFVDDEGTEYQAMPDFIHAATGFYAEFKAHKMNGKKTQRSAFAAMAKVDDDIAKGHLDPAKRPYRELQHAWHHSIQTMACKARQLPSNTPLVLIYEKLQDINEERRCVRNGVFMLSLDNMSCFNAFLRFSSVGLDVSFSRCGFSYGLVPL